MSLWDKAVESLKNKHKSNVNFQREDKHAVLTGILEEVQKKKQACIERRLKYKKKNGDFVILYDVYEKMVTWVTKFKEIGDIAMQYDPGHAALPWAAVRFFLQISVNDVQIFGSFAEGLEMVCKIIARYAAIERLYLRPSASGEHQLENSIIALYASVMVFFSKCRSFYDLGSAQRLARSITQVPEQITAKYLDKIAANDRNVKKLTTIIDAERAQLFAARQSSMTDKIDNLGNDFDALKILSRESASKLEASLASFKDPLVRTVERISTLTESLAHGQNESQTKEERRRILLWLSVVQYKKHHQSISKGLLEETGLWLLERPQFVEWRNSSVSSILWLHGIPGSGKTCLMSTVIGQLLIEGSQCENAAPIAYFYCQRNTAEPRRSDPTEVLRAILKQLLCFNPRWQQESPIAKEYRARKKEADEEELEISSFDISETIDRIVEIASEMPVTILIDALDECRSGQRHELLNALDILLDRSAHLVKVFVSSRDDIDIVLSLQKRPNIYINTNDNKADIRRFIKCEIQKAQRDRRLLKGTASPRLTSLITEHLTVKAGGMFLWVSLQIENLCDSRRIKIEGDLVDELARMPRSLSDMYSLILKNIADIEQHGRTLAETMLKWLLCTKNASLRVTIAACSGIEPTEHRQISIPDILDVCSNLVIYDKALHSFRFAHLSVREFLESQQGYSPSEANRFVLEKSLKTMICNQPSGDLFSSYATEHWVFHYDRLEEEHRKKFFEVHGKEFFFNGAEPSAAYKKWARSTEFYPWSFRNIELGRVCWYLLEEFGVRNEPVNLASCFGWPEILDHFEANQTPNKLCGLTLTMMKIAIDQGQTSVLRWLFDRKFYPKAEHVELAFEMGQSEIVQQVIEAHGPTPDMVTMAIRYSQTSVLRWLFDRKIYPRNEHVELAFEIGQSEIVQQVIEAHSPTLNMMAIANCYGPTSVMRWLFDRKFYPLDDHLELAIEIGQSEIQYCYLTACLLSHYRIDSILENVKTHARWTEILQLIATLPGLPNYASALSTERLRMMADDPVGQILLSLASLFRHEKAFQVLLDLGSDPTCPALCDVRKEVSAVDHIGRSSLSRQEPWDQECGSFDQKMSDELRQAPLAWATYSGNLPLVQSILNQGFNPNIRNRKGQTALYFAVQQTEEKYSRTDLETDKVSIVELLLQKGALLTSADANGGASLVAHAFKARYSKVARVLIHSGVELPKGATNGLTEQLWGDFDRGEEVIRQALLERVQGVRVGLPQVQWPCSSFGWSDDKLNIAARLIQGGMMRILEDAAQEYE